MWLPLNVGSFNRVNGAADGFSELTESWNDGLALRRQSVIEKHLESRLTIVLDVQLAASSDGKRGPVPANGDCQIPEDVMVAVFCVNSLQARDLCYWQQKPMLVSYIECVEGNNGVISSFVRPHNLDDHVAQYGTGLLYFPTFQGCHKFFPGMPYGEINSLPGAQFLSHNPVDEQVQGTSKVVHSIADNRGNVARKRVNDLDPEKAATGAWVFIDSKTIEVGLHECCESHIKIANVVPGSLDF
jgi:hypothetical protein